MLAQLLMLAQDQHPIFNLRNGILVLVLIAVLVGAKMYKNKQM